MPINLTNCFFFNFRGILTLKYGLLLSDTAMIQVNMVAIILNTLYSFLYYKYSEDKYEEVLKPLGLATALVAVFLGYAQIESHENIEFRYGLVLTVLMLLLLGAPLLDVVSIHNSNLKYSMTFRTSFHLYKGKVSDNV